jgi:hypothetical protein
LNLYGNSFPFFGRGAMNLAEESSGEGERSFWRYALNAAV